MFLEKAALIFLLHNFLYIHVHSWNNDELEVFDAVDDVKQNFYTLLNVTQDVDLNGIKKAFRKLSLALHPDKNPSPTAEQDFRHIVTAYEILKSPEKRQYYDKFLEHGMPDWRQAVYYYRRVRKMGLQEMCLILTVIISIGQYLVAWAAYVEEKYTLKELLKSKDKKARKMRKGKSETTFSDEYIESNVKKPSVLNTLPFQICYGIKALTIFLFRLTISTIKDWHKESTVKIPKEQPRQRTEPHQKSNHEKPKRVDFVPEVIGYAPEIQQTTNKKTDEEITKSPPVISGGLWTDDDILDLIKLVKKYPAGESERWQKIACAMNRTVPEVTHMANKIKDNDFRLPAETEEEPAVDPEPKKVKTRGGKMGIVEAEGEEENTPTSNWTQTQQKAFEAALNKYGKKSVDDRWEKISNCVPGKTKEDCMLRYKKIASMVRQRKVVDEVQENSS